jgi:hypothetical protein
MLEPWNEVAMSDAASGPKFLQPKVLLIDLSEQVEEAVVSAGFNARAGTFGQPYTVPPSDCFIPVYDQAWLPNCPEQEVVFIDLTPPEAEELPEGLPPPVRGEMGWWWKCSRGVVDPRPRVMATVREDFDRIWEAGGVFVVFARPRFRQPVELGMVRCGSFEPHYRIDHDNWSFLSFLDPGHLTIKHDPGTESKVLPSIQVVEQFLRRHQHGLEFDCTLQPLYPLTQKGNGPVFIPMMENKYGDPVAGEILPQKPGRGRVFILPQVADKAVAVLDLLRTVLPELSPHLFPFAEGGGWVRQRQYEHPGVLERRARQEEVQRQAAAEVARLDEEIVAERVAFAYLHGLLTDTGGKLVAAAREAFIAAGFKNVIDVDDAEAGVVNKQEDLQVHDRSPTLLVEIKGLGGQPTESDTLQVTKYVLRRMRLWDRTDVQGLSLVNHQRNMPALDRDHDNVFTAQQVQDAEQNGTGLMTTWELFRMLRGKCCWGWPDEAVCGVLYGTGRLPPYPAHYIPVGKVAKFWPDRGVASIDIEGDLPLKLGDRVGFLLPDGFHEEEVTSLQVDRQPVREAFPGQRAGHRTTLGKANLPLRTPVFVVGG